MSTRRSFLASILAAGVAPAAVGSSILMPVKAIVPAIPLSAWSRLGDIVVPRCQPGTFWLDIGHEQDQAVSCLYQRYRGQWDMLEISIVDASGWPLDDPCRISRSAA